MKKDRYFICYKRLIDDIVLDILFSVRYSLFELSMKIFMLSMKMLQSSLSKRHE